MNFQELYEQKVVELEDMRRRAFSQQLAVLAILLENDGEVLVHDETFERVQTDTSGWATEESEEGVWFRVVPQASE